MTGWWWRSGSNLALYLALLAACSSSESEEAAGCTPNQFRACDAGCGTDRGVQQCIEIGEGSGQWTWSDCSCVVLDGGFVQRGDGGQAGAAGAPPQPPAGSAGAAGRPGAESGGATSSPDAG